MLLDSIRPMLHDGPCFGGLQLLSSDGVRIAVADDDGAKTVCDIITDAPGTPATIAVSAPLADSHLFWKVGMRPSGPAKPVDGSGCVRISLVNSAPMGCLMDAGDRNVLGFAYSSAKDEIVMRYGVDEEHATFTVVLEIARIPARSQLLLDRRHAAAFDVIRSLSRWMGAGAEPFPVSPDAVEPVFSTWYAYLQAINADELRAQAAGIRDLGCRSIFIDDGWQAFGHGRGYAGCGDWIPDTRKFPDLAATVRALRDEGLRSVLWLAPLLLGERSQIFARMEPYAPLSLDGDVDSGCRVLDPRRAVVRDHVADICARLIRDYGIGGLKIDFLDQARFYQGTPLDDPAPGDVQDVGEAMCMLLAQLRDTVLAQGDDVPVIEFRQPYSSPAIAPYGNIVRASDCPADAVTNRIRTVDERMVSTGRVVHGDMLLWNPAASACACAEQIMASFFAVPQISVPPSSMSDEQVRVCRYLLQVWRDCRDVTLFGRLDPVGTAEGYPLVNAYGDDKQVSVVYGRSMVVDVDATTTRHVVVLNASCESSVVLRLHGAGHTVRLHGNARDCRGDMSGAWDLETSALADDASDACGGLIQLRVPEYGVLTLSVD